MTLMVPELYQNYRLIGIDPGSTHLGIAVFDLNMVDRSIKTIEAFTLHADKIPNYTGLDEEYFGERLIKLHKLKMQIHQLVQRLQPQAVACESPFYNRLRPMAYGVLLETIAYIHTAIIEVNPQIFFRTIEPLMVKKAVGAGFTKGKIDVRMCLESNASIMSVLNTDIDLLDDHALDSIGVGLAFIQNSGVLL